MSKNLKISLSLVVGAVAVTLVAANVGGDDAATRATAGDSDAERLVRADSQLLEDPADSRATFVEFLDFECEACGAAYPAIEQLRETYGDRMTFVVRYMPLHNNSEAASRAAEAAADQDRLEEMYDRLFQTQAEWGEQSTSQEDVFFGFAEKLRLDMGRFRTVYDDQATIDRIRRLNDADSDTAAITVPAMAFVLNRIVVLLRPSMT